MAKLMGWVLFVCLLSVNSLLAQPPTTKPGTAPQKETNVVVEFFRSLDWWIWLLVVLLIVLIVVFIKVRKSQAED